MRIKFTIVMVHMLWVSYISHVWNTGIINFASKNIITFRRVCESFYMFSSYQSSNLPGETEHCHMNENIMNLFCFPHPTTTAREEGRGREALLTFYRQFHYCPFVCCIYPIFAYFRFEQTFICHLPTYILCTMYETPIYWQQF